MSESITREQFDTNLEGFCIYICAEKTCPQCGAGGCPSYLGVRAYADQQDARIVALHKQLRREKCSQCTDKALAGHMDQQDARIAELEESLTIAHMVGHADGYDTGRNSAKEHIEKLEAQVERYRERMSKAVAEKVKSRIRNGGASIKIYEANQVFAIIDSLTEETP